MVRLKAVLGYSVAALCIPLMIFAVGMADVGLALTGLGDTFISATGLKHSANWSGGEVAQTLKHGTYQTEIHRPVFDALIGEHKEGFVQVAWRPADGLPARIDEEIDAGADGQADFRVELDTAARQATLTPYSPNVLNLEGVYHLGETLAIRVALKNPRR